MGRGGCYNKFRNSKPREARSNGVGKGQSFEGLRVIIEERCGIEEFLRQMKMRECRLNKLLCEEAEFRQSEMLCAAKILNLSSGEFNRCFFGTRVQKI